LAEGLPVGGTLALARYENLGGVRGALTQHADTALAKAVQASGRRCQIVCVQDQ